MSTWSIQKARELYNIAEWSDGFFDINEQGDVVAYPRGRDNAVVNLPKLINEIQQWGLAVPTLIRFTDILHERVNRITGAFNQAISQHQYQGKYTIVYPIKVNQQRSVIEEIVRHGGERVGLESGSKPELMAVLGSAFSKDSIIICNGYKDREYIRLALIGQQLGHRVYIIIEKLSEVDLVMEEARKMDVRPRLGIRIRLATMGKGKWQNTAGEKSKFGLSAAQVFTAIEHLQANGMLDTLEAIHFHLGSQIANIRDIYGGMRECARFYAELHALGVKIKIVDVGGGLAVDYDGTRSRSSCSMNYSVQEYANNIVYTLFDVCNEKDLPHPDIITESGRALTAHHAVLVTDVIDTESIEVPTKLAAPTTDDPSILHDLWRGYKEVAPRTALEAYHDASYWIAEVYSMYTHGVLNMSERARAEQIYHATCFKVRDTLDPTIHAHHEIIDELSEKLADKYFCNFSLFQSLPDSWAIDQIFPILPLSGLDQKPNKRAVLQDITCDSDGRVDWYVDGQGLEATLNLVGFDKSKPYFLGMFLVGAYQEILGDMHNLFGDTDSIYLECLDDGKYRLFKPDQGDTVADVLRYVHFAPEELLHSYREKLAGSPLTEQQRKEYFQTLSDGLDGYTYFEE